MIDLLVAALLLVALVLILSALRTRKRIGIEGKVVYSDLVVPGEVMYSERLGLSGKPDYIVKRGDDLIPIEVKSTEPPERPPRSHVLQLAAYCALLEEVTGRRVPYGYIEYRGGKRFRIDYTESLKSELLLTLYDMREALKSGKVDPKPSPAKCRVCSVKDQCPYARRSGLV